MEAVYLVADIASASADTTYRFMIDDLSLAAARDANFEVRTPAAVHVEPWASLVSAKGYRSGTPARSAPCRSRPVRARCVMRLTTGKQPEAAYDGRDARRRAG